VETLPIVVRPDGVLMHILNSLYGLAMITTLGFGVTKYITANVTAITAITIMAIMRIVLLIEEMCPPLNL
jgi:hypothetical protein